MKPPAFASKIPKQQQQQPFYGPLFGTQVSWYQKKHSPSSEIARAGRFVAIFHYTTWFEALTNFEPDSVMEFGFKLFVACVSGVTCLMQTCSRLLKWLKNMD